MTFYQSYYGAAAAMQVADPTGKVVFDQGVPLEWTSNDGKHRVGQILLPDAGLTVYVIGAASGEVDPQIKPGQMQLEVYKSGSESTPIATQIVTQGQPATIAGLDFTFVRERQFTGLIVARDPGAVFVWLGAILLVGGIALVFFFPNRRAWALIRRGPDGTAVHVGAVVRHDVGFQADFERLSGEIQARPGRAERSLKEGAAAMFKMSEYSFIAGVIAVGPGPGLLRDRFRVRAPDPARRPRWRAVPARAAARSRSAGAARPAPRRRTARSLRTSPSPS